MPPHSLSSAAPGSQVRRLRIQIRLKTENSYEDDVKKRPYNSALPFLPPLVRLQTALLHS